MTLEYVRVVRGAVQTSVRRFEHPDTGRTVTVIGTYHLGTAPYYEGLREVIDKLEANGAVVHHEGTRPTNTATDEEQDILELLDIANTQKAELVTAAGWPGQIEGLGYPDSWQNVDLTTLDIVRRLGLPAARQMADRLMRMQAMLGTGRTGVNRVRLMIAVLFRWTSNEKRVIKAASRNATDEVIVKARDQVALAGVAGTDRDVVLIWGLAHLPGLHTGLLDLGFERTGLPQWHTVVKRRPSIIAALLRMAVRWPAPRRARVAASHDPAGPS